MLLDNVIVTVTYFGYILYDWRLPSICTNFFAFSQAFMTQWNAVPIKVDNFVFVMSKCSQHIKVSKTECVRVIAYKPNLTNTCRNTTPDLSHMPIFRSTRCSPLYIYNTILFHHNKDLIYCYWVRHPQTVWGITISGQGYSSAQVLPKLVMPKLSIRPFAFHHDTTYQTFCSDTTSDRLPWHYIRPFALTVHQTFCPDTISDLLNWYYIRLFTMTVHQTFCPDSTSDLLPWYYIRYFALTLHQTFCSDTTSDLSPWHYIRPFALTLHQSFCPDTTSDLLP